MNRQEQKQEIAHIVDAHTHCLSQETLEAIADNIIFVGYWKRGEDYEQECILFNTCKETSPHHHLAEDNYEVMICDGKPDDSGREKICCQLGRRYCEENKMNSSEESSKPDDSNACQLETLPNEELVNSLSYWSEQKSKGYFSFDDKLSDLASKKIKEISKEIERRML